MIKVALALWLRLHDPTDAAPRYTLADLKADNPYTLRDYMDRPPLYTDQEFAQALDAQR
jgi:hypothetical protein